MRLFLLAALFAPVPAFAADVEGVKFYESKVRPVLVEHCYSCHAAGAKKLKGDLRLDAAADWLRGGSSGPAVVPGKPDESPLVHAVRRGHADFSAMPPDTALTDSQVADLVEWVRRGAPAPEVAPARVKEDLATAKARWPFTPLPTSVPTPAVKSAWAETPIDRFLLARLDAKGLTPVGDAAPHVLARRLTFDLTGLPPTPAEVEAFSAAHARDPRRAVAALVDRLLASPAYGERWGRHWLDVVRYADTAGDNADFPIPQMARYRDYVIGAFNRDLPFDQFAREQIAGDLMGGSTEAERHSRVVATGYLANARRFGSRVDDYPTHLTIEDTIDNLGRAFLGLTMNCSRCHDHKFDPIPMADYYAVYGILASTRYPWPGIELEQRQRDLVPLCDAGTAARAEWRRHGRVGTLTGELQALEAAEKAAPKESKAEAKKAVEAKKRERDQVLKSAPAYPTAYAVAEGKARGDAKLQLKGDPAKPAAAVPRGFLQVLGGDTLPASDPGSGRLFLADRVTAPANPLFARVLVNRVWQHHFGRGLVATPNDFGKQGAAPTHPELLDYLAARFVARGYSVKALHREILTSHAYRLASDGEVPGAETTDPNNDLLGKFRRRRLDAEAIRDSLLALSGRLDTSPAGPHPFPEPSDWAFTQHNPFRAVYETDRRSVYLMTQRIQRHPYLATFDGADTGASTGSRVTSTTPLQSLYFLNDAFVHAQAAALAARARQDSEGPADRIDALYRRLFARPPTPDEQARGAAYVEKVQSLTNETAAWESYARSLLRLNEFVYVD